MKALASRRMSQLASLCAACLGLLLIGHRSEAQPLDPATHGRSAQPDYARVFPQDRVSRLDLQVTAADWQQLMDDMTGMAGAFGAGVSATAGQTAVEAAGGDDVELLPQTPVYIPATVVFDGITFPTVGLRLKGNSTLLESWRAGRLKLPLRLNFDEFESRDPRVRDQTFFGFQNVSLSNSASDASLVRAKVAHDLFREAGVPSPVAAFTRVYLDRGSGPEYLGLYTLVEIPGRAMLRTQFGESGGNLYKPSGGGARWTTFAAEDFPKKTNEDDADWSDIRKAIAALHASRADAASWRAGLEATFNVDGFLKWLALNTVIGNRDTYGGLAPHNYYLYADPRQRDRLQWIPWDLDRAFWGASQASAGEPVDLFHRRLEGDWPLIRLLLDDTTYLARYRAHLDSLLASVLDPGHVTARLRQEHAMIAPHVVGAEGEHPGRSFVASPEAFDRALEQLARDVAARMPAARVALAEAR
jgi:spore coat protein H